MSFMAKFSWIILSLVVCTVAADLCENVDETILKEQLYNSAAPKGGRHAGKYRHGMIHGKNATNLLDCLISCCDQPTCNVMFFHLQHCYHIECNRTLPDGCDPVQNDKKEYLDTYYIIVRTLEETASLYTENNSHSPDGSTTEDVSDENVAGRDDCSTDSSEHCGVNEQCSELSALGELFYACTCIQGFVRDDQELCSVRSCEFGLRQCLDHEECVHDETIDGVGRCACVSGYVTDPVTQLCVASQTDSVTVHGGTGTSGQGGQGGQGVQGDQGDQSGQGDQAVQGGQGGQGGPGGQASPNSTTTASSTLNPATPQPQPLAPLVVSAGDNQVIVLPKNDLTLHAFVIPSDDQHTYQYHWTLESETAGEDVGEMVGINTDSLQVSHLVARLYTFKVVVTAEGGNYGEAYVNVTVRQPTRINSPPQAVIKPATQTVSQPNDMVLDGSESTDDDKITEYLWEQVSKPMEAPGIPDEDRDKSILVLKSHSPGAYKFKLTVTDSDGAQNHTFANVTVLKETDYPPQANAGSNVIISLPQNSVTLLGNASTDDKGIASFEWIKNSDDKLTADMKGVRTPVLQLENLEEGSYTFTLKVTDTAGQVDTADVHVFVKAEHNKAPLASAGLNQTVWLPQNIVTLDATNSSDDQRVDSYQWSQVSGPNTAGLENGDRAIATALNLEAGVYLFKVVVSDEEGLRSSNNVYVTVKQNQNQPPTANAGGRQVVSLPAPLVRIDGSKSVDDRAIVSWTWTRDDDSLAAGNIINGSDQRAILQLTDLVAGRYMFTLTVVDGEGLSATDAAALIVNPAKNRDNLVEIRLNANVHTFSERNKNNLESQIALLLHKNMPNSKAHIQELKEDPSSGDLLVIFFASQTLTGSADDMIPGPMVASILKNRLWTDENILDFSVVSIDTLICQDNCTDHGHCDQRTKKCICEAFWMQNPFKTYIDGHSNCQWSVLYVIIVSFVTLVTLIGVVWGFVFLCRKWHWTRPKKRHRYSLLNEVDDLSESNNLEMMQKGKLDKPQSGSLMISETDFSSDEETLFINKKAVGQAVKRGLGIPNRNKVKA